MPELLLELFSEEIPARMQSRAAADLERLVNERLLGAGFLPEGVKAFAGPRRLTLVATGLPGRQPDRREEKKGPRVGAPEKAVEGFLKSAGLSSLEACEVREDKKGAYYVAIVDEKGRATADVVAGFVPDIVRAFPWPKSMRWGDGDLRWVRPLKSILCCFDGEVVPFEIDGIVSGDETEGHRFMAPGKIRARTFDKYAAQLQARKVILDGAARAELIAAEARTLCEAQGLELVEDKGLLAEVAGLAEWPAPMMGAFDEKFLALPDEVLTASMRGHQKYFSVRDPNTGRLANRFVYVANIEAPDGGRAMRAGYERVLTARLSDAWYLYHQDLKTPLKDRIEHLDRITFFEGLGSVGDKARRVAALAKEIAPAVGADPQLAEEAALLAKADLTTAMVREFPELQGVMGRYYKLQQGLHETSGAQIYKNHQIADAIRDHYKPQGADDDVPTAPVTVAVALADRIDTLTSFWSIGKKPTGSSDPFALRRAALGLITITLASELRLRLREILVLHRSAAISTIGKLAAASLTDVANEFASIKNELDNKSSEPAAIRQRVRERINKAQLEANELNAFFHDRLKVYLRDAAREGRGHRHDHIDAVLTKPDGTPEDDLVLIVRKLEALEAFLKTDDGVNLAAGYKRAANILKAEEKKDVGRVERSDTRLADGAEGGGYRPATSTRPTVDERLLQQAEEKALYSALEEAEAKAANAVANEKFADAMAALAGLRAPIDAFFEKVTVNAEDSSLRANRLALLARFRDATATVADLSKLEG